MDMPHEIPPQIGDWLRRQLGEYRVLRCMRQGSNRTCVWQLESTNLRSYFKMNYRRVRFETELFVYSRWIEALKPFAPELIGVLFESNGLLISDLEGEPLRELSIDPKSVVETYEVAGKICRRLHDLDKGSWFGAMDAHGSPIKSDSVEIEGIQNPAARYEALMLESLAAVRPQLLDEERRLVERTLVELTSLSFPFSVPTSLDFTPGNWIVNRDGKLLGVIDFENMVWGLRTDPSVRLSVDYFPAHPEFEAAFCNGYGGNPVKTYPAHFRIGCILYGLGYLGLGIKRGDSPTIDRGHRAFQVIAQLG